MFDSCQKAKTDLHSFTSLNYKVSMDSKMAKNNLLVKNKIK